MVVLLAQELSKKEICFMKPSLFPFLWYKKRCLHDTTQTFIEMLKGFICSLLRGRGRENLIFIQLGKEPHISNNPTLKLNPFIPTHYKVGGVWSSHNLLG